MMEEKAENILAEILNPWICRAESMNILRKFVWLLLTLGLLVLTVQTASPVALGLMICMVVLPLLCLP